jgi:hypothetical protein
MIMKSRCAVLRTAEKRKAQSYQGTRHRGQAPARSFFVLSILLLPCGGCSFINMAEAWTNITGGEFIDAEYKLTKEPLLILIDDRNSFVTEPRASVEAYKTIAAIFLEKHVNDRLIPFEECRRLQQSDRTYHKLSIRQIGEKLGASEVLYLRVEKFTLFSEPGAAIFKGEFTVRIKVVSTDRKKDTRMWPDSEAGRRISVGTDPTPADGDKSATDVATELGIKLGKSIAMLFYGHRELEK